jgi:hypothetical protein
VKPLIRPPRRSFLESRRKRELLAKQSVPAKGLPVPPGSGPGAARTYHVSSPLTPGPALQHPDAPASPISETPVPATSVLSPFRFGPLSLPPPSHCLHSCPLACSCLFAQCAGLPETHGPGKHQNTHRPSEEFRGVLEKKINFVASLKPPRQYIPITAKGCFRSRKVKVLD